MSWWPILLYMNNRHGNQYQIVGGSLLKDTCVSPTVLQTPTVLQREELSFWECFLPLCSYPRGTCAPAGGRQNQKVLQEETASTSACPQRMHTEGTCRVHSGGTGRGALSPRGNDFRICHQGPKATCSNHWETGLTMQAYNYLFFTWKNSLEGEDTHIVPEKEMWLAGEQAHGWMWVRVCQWVCVWRGDEILLYFLNFDLFEYINS